MLCYNVVHKFGVTYTGDCFSMNCDLPHFRKTIAAIFCSLIFAGASPSALSADRHHDAHEHGVSKLNLVIEGKRLEMELGSPGSDIVGFEHAPATDADRKAIVDAAERLKDGATLFVTPAAAGCNLQSAEIEAPGAEKKEKHHGHGHDHGKDKHGHQNYKADEETHSEFHAHYRYVCDHPKKLSHIDAKFFAVFPRAREIEVRAITPENQFRRELTAENTRLTL